MKNIKLFEDWKFNKFETFDFTDDDFDWSEEENDFPIDSSKLTDDEFRNLLQIGDRVNISFRKLGYKKYYNNLNGIVLSNKLSNNRMYYGIQFDKYIEGHSCDSIGKYGYCWYVNDFILNMIY